MICFLSFDSVWGFVFSLDGNACPHFVLCFQAVGWPWSRSPRECTCLSHQRHSNRNRDTEEPSAPRWQTNITNNDTRFCAADKTSLSYHLADGVNQSPSQVLELSPLLMATQFLGKMLETSKIVSVNHFGSQSSVLCVLSLIISDSAGPLLQLFSQQQQHWKGMLHWNSFFSYGPHTPVLHKDLLSLSISYIVSLSLPLTSLPHQSS